MTNRDEDLIVFNEFVTALNDALWWVDTQEVLTSDFCYNLASYLDELKAAVLLKAEKLKKIEEC